MISKYKIKILQSICFVIIISIFGKFGSNFILNIFLFLLMGFVLNIENFISSGNDRKKCLINSILFSVLSTLFFYIISYIASAL